MVKRKIVACRVIGAVPLKGSDREVLHVNEMDNRPNNFSNPVALNLSDLHTPSLLAYIRRFEVGRIRIEDKLTAHSFDCYV